MIVLVPTPEPPMRILSRVQIVARVKPDATHEELVALVGYLAQCMPLNTAYTKEEAEKWCDASGFGRHLLILVPPDQK